MTELHDRHAIPAGDDGPPTILDLLLTAIRAVIALLHNPTGTAQDAMDAIAAYAQVAGLTPDDATEQLIGAVEQARRSTLFTGDELDVFVSALYAQRPDGDPLAARYVDATGRIFRPFTRRNKFRLRPQGSPANFTIRQAVRQHGALIRLDLLHAPVTHYDAAPGAEEPDAVYQVCAHDGEPWPCRIAVSAGIAPEPVTAPAAVVEFATEAPF